MKNISIFLVATFVFSTSFLFPQSVQADTKWKLESDALKIEQLGVIKRCRLHKKEHLFSDDSLIKECLRTEYIIVFIDKTNNVICYEAHDAVGNLRGGLGVGISCLPYKKPLK